MSGAVGLLIRRTLITKIYFYGRIQILYVNDLNIMHFYIWHCLHIINRAQMVSEIQNAVFISLGLLEADHNSLQFSGSNIFCSPTEINTLCEPHCIMNFKNTH